MAATLLFPLGVRLSTWLCALAFAVLARRQRSILPLVAAWVWLIGFEAVFDGFGLAIYGYVPDRVLPLVLGLFTFAWCWRTRMLRVSPSWIAAGALLWVVWLALGFHWNTYDAPSEFSWQPEVLNEAAKTAWALAYLMPLASGSTLKRSAEQPAPEPLSDGMGA